MKSTRNYFKFAFYAFILISCASSKLTATWQATPGQSYHFKNIAIIGIANNADIRKSVEDAMETDLESKGFHATGALMFLPPEATKETISKDIVIAILKDNNFDAVITINLVKKESDTTYVPGQYYYVPNYSVPFNDFYGQTANFAYSGGYYDESTTFILQTNLYNFPEGKMLWSAQTHTTPLSEISATAQALSLTLCEALLKDKIIIP
jgi:hypothetical protein